MDTVIDAGTGIHKGHCRCNQAATEFIWLALRQVEQRWKKPPISWHAAKAQLAIPVRRSFRVESVIPQPAHTQNSSHSKEEEISSINRADRSTYLDEESVLRGRATSRTRSVGIVPTACFEREDNTKQTIQLFRFGRLRIK